MSQKEKIRNLTINTVEEIKSLLKQEIIFDASLINLIAEILGKKRNKNKLSIIDLYRQTVEKYKHYLSSIDLDVNYLFNNWQQSFHNNEGNDNDKETSEIAKLLTLQLSAMKGFAIFQYITAHSSPNSFSTSFATALSLVGLSQFQYLVSKGFSNPNPEQSIEFNLSHIKRLSAVNKKIPSKLVNTYFIKNFSRYPVAHLIEQSTEKINPDHKKILFINSISDDRGALIDGFASGKLSQTMQYLKAKRNGYEITIAEPSTLKELIQLIQNLQGNKYDYLIFSAHGSQNTIRISEECRINNNGDFYDFFKEIRLLLNPNSQILLAACSTGKGDNNIASYIANITEIETVGLTENSAIRFSFSKKKLLMKAHKGNTAHFKPNN